MTINRLTYNEQARNKVAFALRKINEYYASREIKKLQDADIALSHALKSDPNYLDAIFYYGLTKDLIGQPADALPYFKKIEDESNEEKIVKEAQLNLAISHYHLYGHKNLAEAERYFLQLLTNVKSQNLKYLILSYLAQTYAMWMIPSWDQKQQLEDNQNTAEIFDFIKGKFSQFESCRKEVRTFLNRRTFFVKVADKIKIEATVNNAEGMALMYASDYLYTDAAKRIEVVKRALVCLKKAGKNISNDWANTCDLASVNWRLGMLVTEDQKNLYFEKAINLLQFVIKDLRPNYGFAIYELGRIYRTKGEFEIAIKYFNQALQIPDQYRDVSGRTVNREKQRALDQDVTYP